MTMSRKTLRISIVLLALGCAAAWAQPASSVGPVRVFATGLDNPRGLKFGPDNRLYVAEGGVGGDHSTTPADCEQVPAPIGPYSGAATGARISRILADGTVQTVTSGLPSSQTQPVPGPLVSGVADVAFLGNTLYAVLAGAGCSHGVPEVPNSLIRVDRDGTWHVVADLGAFEQAHPVANPEPDDFEPDGTWYSLQQVGGVFFTVEPNHGELDMVTPSGQIARLIDISASQGHVVPTALAWRGGYFYVSNLTPFPLAEGAAKIFRVGLGGNLKVLASGLTGVVGLAFDRYGQLYALEMSAPGFPAPSTGRVVRVSRAGEITPIVTGLMFPTGMTFDSSGKVLYISNFGFGGPPGAGQILKARILR